MSEAKWEPAIGERVQMKMRNERKGVVDSYIPGTYYVRFDDNTILTCSLGNLEPVVSAPIDPAPVAQSVIDAILRDMADGVQDEADAAPLTAYINDLRSRNAALEAALKDIITDLNTRPFESTNTLLDQRDWIYRRASMVLDEKG